MQRFKYILLAPVLTAMFMIFTVPRQVDAQTSSVKVPRGYFVAKFRNIELKDFLKTMAQITRRNILIDEGLRGKITIVSYRPIPVSRALAFMKQVLKVKGYAIIEDRNLIRVRKIRDASQENIPQQKNPTAGSAGVISRVLRFPGAVRVTQLRTLLNRLVGSKDTTIAAYQPTNALIITGYAQNVRRAITILDELGLSGQKGKNDPGDTSGGSVHIYRAKNMTAESLAQVLVRLDNPQIAVGAKGKGTKKNVVRTPRPGARAAKIKAVAHKESNSVIVTASPEEWSEIRAIIQRLDAVRKQLLLEVLIVEISSTKLNDFGIDWRFQGNSGPHTQFNTGRVLEGGLVNENGRITGNNTLSGFSLGFLEKGGELLGIFNANISNQNFNVLSAPQIMTLDNQEAEINVGQDVPVRKQERTSGGGTAEATVNSFDYRPAGIKLKFTPHINPDGIIGIDLFQEVTNIEGGISTATNPTFNKRSVKTFVTVKNKQTIVIGGLVNSERQHSVQKIPLLGDIPLLGFLFRRTTYSTKKTNLMVFITPHVLNNPQEAARVSTFKREEQIRASRKRSDELKLWPEQKSPDKRKDALKQIEFNK